MAELLQDERWSLSEYITTPSLLVAVDKPQQLDYEAAASFVRYLRVRFGMPALLELYAALDDVDAQGTPDVFLAVLGVDWDDVEGGYYVTYSPDAVGSINCDFPELAPEAGAWTIPVDSPCEDAGTIGPFLGWYESDIPYSERYVTLNVPEAGVYTVSLTSSADVSIVLIDCDEPLEYYSRYDSRLAARGESRGNHAMRQPRVAATTPRKVATSRVRATSRAWPIAGRVLWPWQWDKTTASSRPSS